MGGTTSCEAQLTTAEVRYAMGRLGSKALPITFLQDRGRELVVWNANHSVDVYSMSSLAEGMIVTVEHFGKIDPLARYSDESIVDLDILSRFDLLTHALRSGCFPDGAREAALHYIDDVITTNRQRYLEEPNTTKRLKIARMYLFHAYALVLMLTAFGDNEMKRLYRREHPADMLETIAESPNRMMRVAKEIYEITRNYIAATEDEDEEDEDEEDEDEEDEDEEDEDEEDEDEEESYESE